MTTSIATPVHRQQGFFLIEALVSIVIIAFGLLGMAGMILKTQGAEVESFQRAQALLIIQDMANRMKGDKANAANYIGNYDAVNGACDGTINDKTNNTCLWTKALYGASETISGQAVGGLLNGMGCITSPEANVYEVSVAWQGLNSSAAPLNPCGQGNYGDDGYRRVVSMVVYL